MKKILVGTHNKGKFKEISSLISKKYKKVSPITLNIKSPKETGKSFLANSKLKAIYFSKFVNFALLKSRPFRNCLLNSIERLNSFNDLKVALEFDFFIFVPFKPIFLLFSALRCRRELNLSRSNFLRLLNQLLSINLGSPPL